MLKLKLKASETKVKLLAEELENSNNGYQAQQLQEALEKLFVTELNLMEAKQQLRVAQDEVAIAKEQAELFEEKQTMAEERAEKAEEDLCLSKVTIYNLEMKTLDDEARLSSAIDHANKVKRDLVKLSEETKKANTDLFHISEKAQATEAELIFFRDKSIKIEEELNQSRLTSAKIIKEMEEKIEIEEQRATVAEEALQRAEVRINQVEEEILEAKKRADEAVDEMQLKLKKLRKSAHIAEIEIEQEVEKRVKEAVKKEGKMEECIKTNSVITKEEQLEEKAELKILYRNSLMLEKMLCKANEKAAKAERELALIKEEDDLKDKMLRDAVEEAERLAQIANNSEADKQLLIKESRGTVMKLQKELREAVEQLTKTQANLAAEESEHMSCTIELENKIGLLSKLEEKFDKLSNYMETAETHFGRVQNNYEENIVEIQIKNDELRTVLDKEIHEKEEASNTVSFLLS